MTEFKITLPGTDIGNSRLADEVVDARYPSPKINAVITPPHVGIVFLNWQSSNIVMALGEVRVLYSFPHQYNHIPATFGVYSYDNGLSKGAGVMPIYWELAPLGRVILDADDINVNIKYQSTDTASTPITPFIAKIRFYVMAERGME